MILTCPACGTQYVVKDGAIPEGGRKVRCAACRHSWHQDPEPLELEEPVEGEDPLEAEEPPMPEAFTTDVDEDAAGEYPPATGPETAPGEAYDDAGDHQPTETEDAPGEDVPAESSWDEAPGTDRARGLDPDAETVIAPAAEISAPADLDDDFSPFADRSPASARRRSPLVAILVVILVVAALAAAFWFLAPSEWKARVGLTAAAQTPLQLMMTHSDRQALASGNELLAISGRVINPTRRPQRVPPIQAELRSSSGNVVYRWTIAPPTPMLAPGASARFNSAEVNVPAGGEELTVSLGPPGA